MNKTKYLLYLYDHVSLYPRLEIYYTREKAESRGKYLTGHNMIAFNFDSYKVVEVTPPKW